MTYTSSVPQENIEALQQGKPYIKLSRANFASFYKAMHSDIYRYLRSLIREGQNIEIDDMVQETFRRLLETIINREKEQSSLYIDDVKRYALRAARYTLLDHLRKQKLPIHLKGSEDEANEVCDELANIEVNAEIHDDLRHVLSAIEMLKEPMRTTMLLTIEGCKEQEVAQKLNLNINTVKSQIRRGRKMLRDSLKRSNVNDGPLQKSRLSSSHV